MNRARTSDVWLFFTHDKKNNTAICKCGEKYVYNSGGTTTSLKRHVQRDHKELKVTHNEDSKQVM